MDMASPGPATGADTAGDCARAECDAEGNVFLAPFADPLVDGLECTQDLCTGDVPSNPPVTAGQACSQNGGVMCDGNGRCVQCLQHGDCASRVCVDGTCQPPTCTDLTPNGQETDEDCGGPMCNPCADGKLCTLGADCTSHVCGVNQRCAMPTCQDQVHNGQETGTDCGGPSCPKCGPLQGCNGNADCVGGQCSGSVCVPNCVDSVTNQGETDTDCGGPSCSACAIGKTCSVDGDCSSHVCTPGTQVCAAPSCTDGRRNNAETDTDCGGGTCPSCATGLSCTLPRDCLEGVCTGLKCQGPSCTDQVRNGVESDTDCGGGVCPPCAVGGRCGTGADCTSRVCTQNTCHAAVCGDGIRSPGEACEDGNTTNGDGCSINCAVESGFTCTGSPSVCTTTCGDGIKASTEACDDHNTTNGDGCSATCAVERGYACSGTAPSVCGVVCGDGITLPSEACDDGNLTEWDGCTPLCTVEMGFTCTGSPSACTAICGDGFMLGAESCDDDNTNGGDGCSSVCTVETGYRCSGNPSTCTPVCGDGRRVGAESCDDGNASTGDGCGSDCQVELGFTCTGTPSVCTAICGDGFKMASEACDDGNTTSGDGCTATCTVETGYACTGSPSACAPVCGDGLRIRNEQCDDGNTVNGDGCSSTCQVEATVETEPNDTCGWANGPITIPARFGGAVVKGTLSAGDTEWFKFTVSNWADLSFQTFDQQSLSTCALPLDTQLQFYQSDCITPLGSLQDQGGINNCSLLNNSTQPAAMNHVAPGTYFMKVSAKTAATGGAYFLQARYTALCGNGVVEGSETCDGGANCGTDCRPLSACGNGILEGTETCDDGNTTNGDGCSSTCAWEITAEVEPNDTTAQADMGLLITGNRNVLGALGSATDVDIFKLIVAANDTVVHLETFDSSGSDCRAGAPYNMVSHNLSLLNSTGARLVKDYGSNPYYSATTQAGIGVCAALSVRLDAGTYYVQVDNTVALPAYFLRVIFQTTAGSETEPNDSLAMATTAAGRDLQVFGGHQLTTDADWFAVSVPAGASLRAELVEGDTLETCESMDMDSVLTLYNALGAALGSDNDLGRGNCSILDGTGSTPQHPWMHALAAGTYYLRVTSSGSGTPTQFNYRLVVNVRY